MSKKKLILIACLLLIGSCNKTPTNLPFTNDAAKNNQIIKAFIPSGTPASNAITRMEQEGFSCKIVQDEKTRSPKETIQLNKSSSVDFVWCERKTGIIFPGRWQVIMSLDSEDKIDNVYVTTGL
jgi:hypothetical protein